jgi:FtsP/CotA-like multicopper oxidase with cupredoxin domain
VHISGETPADDVTRTIPGQWCGDYVYDIPDDHMGGTYWYHAHHHGSTYLQVSGGAFGLILIDDSRDLVDGTGEGVPQSVLDMTERQLVIAYLDPSVAGTGGDSLISGTLDPTWTVNGVVGGSLDMPANEWQHWRVLLADRDARQKTVSVGPECQVALLARDGVWRMQAPKDLPTASLDLTGASRADLAVNCAPGSNPTISVDGQVVANVNVGEPGNSTVGPYSDGATGGLWSANRPDYLRNLLDEPGPFNEQTINMGARTVSGSKFELDVPTFSIDQPGIQEWTIKGATNHPFHLHIYHMQVVEDCGDFEAGEYYDTIAASCRVRFDVSQTTAYEGRTIMHCHILAHEDQGAMGWADVLFGEPPPDFPDSSQQALYLCASGPGCEPTPGEEVAELSCADGVDNDCNGLIDGDDPNCTPPPPPAECSQYTDSATCRQDKACRWNNKDGICINK